MYIVSEAKRRVFVCINLGLSWPIRVIITRLQYQCHCHTLLMCFPWPCWWFYCCSLSFRLFDRGLAYVGSDYLSFTLWDKYIEYEYMQQEWSRLASIYTRILENPNQQLDRYFNRWFIYFFGFHLFIYLSIAQRCERYSPSICKPTLIFFFFYN